MHRTQGRQAITLTKRLSQTEPFDTLFVPILTALTSQMDVSPLPMVTSLTKLVSATIGVVGRPIAVK